VNFPERATLIWPASRQRCCHEVAQSEDCAGNKERTKVFFVNGMYTTEDQAVQNREAQLMPHLRPRIQNTARQREWDQ